MHNRAPTAQQTIDWLRQRDATAMRHVPANQTQSSICERRSSEANHSVQIKMPQLASLTAIKILLWLSFVRLELR